MHQVQHTRASSILSKATGFISAFDYTLNPYSGCAFGCSYCYAAFFTPSPELQETWGQWVKVKENALALLQKRRKRPLTGKAIYMSSVTDPYQPVEKSLELTRALLDELARYHQPRLVIQTRGTLVTRDIDLLRQFEQVQVNMTVTTDDETVRRAFEPFCPSNARRLEAVRQLSDAGIRTCVALTPLLPVADAEAFAGMLRASGAQKFVTQMFHPTKARFAAGTGETARRLAAEMGWDAARYVEVVRVLRAHLPEVYEGKAGFTPVGEG